MLDRRAGSGLGVVPLLGSGISPVGFPSAAGLPTQPAERGTFALGVRARQLSDLTPCATPTSNEGVAVSDEENFELIRRFNQVNAAGDLGVLDEILAPDFLARNGEQEVHGPDGWRQFVLAGREQYGESEGGIDELIGNGNMVAERWWLRAAAGTRRGITMHRIVDGKLEEDWMVAQDG